MPGDLTLSQLLTLLNERGVPDGMSLINFTMKLKAKDSTISDKRFKYDKGELIIILSVFLKKIIDYRT